MLVRIVKDWAYPKTFFQQTPNGDGAWGNITFTEDRITSCDFLIVLQRPPYDISCKCPDGRAWLITQEPPVSYFRFYTRSFKYFDRVYSYYNDVAHHDIRQQQPALPWHVLRSYTFLKELKYSDLGHKIDELVWITSNKSGFPGQAARMKFKALLDEKGYSYNLYGNGFQPIEDKFDALIKFKYSLAIENYCTPHYWTEKLADSFLSWCLPFYWGAPNLADYFPEDSYIRIDISDPERAMDTIKQAILNREWEKRLKAIERARALVLDRYQFFPYMSNLINKEITTRSEWPIRAYNIPANNFPIRTKVADQLNYYWRRVFKPS